MIEDYVNKLIENLPDESKKLQRLDLVLDGGIFNGSYLVGALYFIKEMERRKYAVVERISGCSIGSIIAFLYFIDSLDLIPTFYNKLKSDFKKHYSLKMLKTLKSYLKDRIPSDICDRVNNRLFICYNDIKQRKKIIKSTYKNVDDIINSIIKSSYIPFLIDNNFLHNNKYIDGINAYIFKQEPNKKILHMELFGYDKFVYCINIKNEKTNFHRILSGLLDIHCFYIKKSSTSMCSFVGEWNVINKFNYNIKLLFEFIIIHVVYFVNYFKQYLPEDIKDNLFIKIISNIALDIFRILMDTYCL